MHQMRLLTHPDGARHAGHPGAPRRNHRTRYAVAGFVMTTLLAILTACGGTTAGPAGGATAAPSPSATTPASTTVKVYFSKHPDSDNNPAAVFAVTRTPTGADAPTFALEEMLKGPTQAEQSQGYYSPYSGALALMSNCSGEFRDFDLIADHRGAKAEPGTVTLRFCRRVDIRGDLDGPRMTAMATQTLLQFPQFKRVVILNWQGDCFDDLRGDNACLGGQPTGYPVKVYFSRHPNSDDDPTAVFPVSRTSPTLGVATYAVSQIIAGPTQAEQSQGYYTPLQGALSGTSNCAGADFVITLDHKGLNPQTGTATLQFCRLVLMGGEMTGPRIKSEITATLKQFPNIHQVVILDRNGGCFDDLSGLNQCLK